MKTVYLTGNQPAKLTLDSQNLEKGVYFLSITVSGENIRKIQKFVK